MDSQQFRDLQRRGAIAWVDPEEERKQKSRRWSVSTSIGIGAAFLSAVVYGTFNPFVLGSAFFLAFVACFAVMEPEEHDDPFPL